MNMNVDMASDVDSYGIEECPSDEERAASSSEDELDVLLNGTPDQKRKLIREYLTGESESSSGDEFEKEMDAELNSTIRTMEGSWAGSAACTAGTVGQASVLPEGQTSDPAPQTQYDDVYFDSDSEEENRPSSSTGRRRSQRRILTNDELLYDPDEDDRDQAWVDAKRREYSGKRAKLCAKGQGAVQNLSSSDAVLNCPSCMTTLCLDCQRHERYRSQYRAMFVLNCSVNTEEVLRYKTQNHKKNRNRKRKNTPAAATSTTTTEASTSSASLLESDEVYHPVLCSECSTEVAVFDRDEVYHFFNILASHC